LLDERAELDFPTIEEVRPGIWALPLPLPGPLMYVYVYLVAVDDGLLLIDGGWESEQAFAALEAGVNAVGSDLGEVQGVLFTHAHPDHYGLARHVVRASGAWTALHADEVVWIERLRNASRSGEEIKRWIEQLGVDAAERSEIEDSLSVFRDGRKPPLPTRTIADGEVFEVSGGALVAIHTPGHAPGHVCFVHREAGVVFAGDHVLSSTTPNVSAYAGSPPNPLGDYLASLRRVVALGELLTLPGHEQRVSIAPRANEIITHHEMQLRSIERIVRSETATAAAIARQMKWSSPWERLGPRDRYMAMSEALAHVIVLERQGVLERTGDMPMRWRTASGSDSLVREVFPDG
jgi:glyoxylase-like metal-dependent hydrolase (beta-lactamase superfamily II)